SSAWVGSPVSHTYTSTGTYAAQITSTPYGPAGSNFTETTLGTVKITVSPVSEKPTGTFSASPTSGSAPLAVTFSGRVPVAGSYTIDFGNGQSQKISFSEGLCSDGTNLGICGLSLDGLLYTYTTNGTYTATLVDPGGCTPAAEAQGCLGPPTRLLGSVTITVSGGVSPSVTVVTPRSGQSFSFGDTIPVSWKTSGIPSDAGMYLQLVDRSTGYAIKSQKVKPGAGSASINTGINCNDNFSDAIDGDCFSLRNGIDEGKTSYFIRAAIYTPSNACFGYCARTPGTPETKILAEDESDTFSIISGQSPGTFSASPTSGTAPLSVTFSGLSGNSISFGDGSSAYIIDATYEGITIPHTYTKSGTYVATNNGRSVTITVTGGTQAALPTATIEAGYANTYSKDGLLIGPVGTSVVAWWKSTNAKSCTLTSTSPTKWDGSWTGVGGNILVKIENQRAVYTITCTNADGKKASASVIVSPPPSPEVSLDVQSQMASTLIAVENFLRGLQTVFPR
ncbi:MAG: hypothetical protein Q8P19_04720, partial [bacterium]|nr:hypothetical protein [bacterium]